MGAATSSVAAGPLEGSGPRAVACPWQGGAVALKNSAQIDAMRPAGRFVAGVLSSLRDIAREGMTLKQLDTHAHQMIDAAGAHSVYLGYHPSFGAMPYPGVLCTSVNDAALHGLPSDHVLADGDVLSIDFAAQLQGWVADSALTFQIGSQDPTVTALIETTDRALAAGIAKAVPGGRMGDISAAIGTIGRAGGYGINADFGGHGVGRTMHEDPHVPNLGRPGTGLKLKAGLVDRHRAVVHGGWRRLHDRPRRLDDPDGRRFRRCPRGAHHRDHAGRPPGPHRARLTSRSAGDRLDRSGVPPSPPHERGL